MLSFQSNLHPLTGVLFYVPLVWRKTVRGVAFDSVPAVLNSLYTKNTFVQLVVGFYISSACVGVTCS